MSIFSAAPSSLLFQVHPHPIDSWRFSFNWLNTLGVSQRHSEFNIGLDMLGLAFLLKLVGN